MPVILALDTSGAFCSVAIAVDGVVHVDSQRVNRQHNLHILGSIDGLCRGAGIVARDIDGIAFVKGPGSFTGVRLAVSVTQGIAMAAEARVLGVTTSLALALHARNCGVDRCVTLVPSRADSWYVAAFQSGATDDGSGLVQQVADQLFSAPPPWIADYPIASGGRPSWLSGHIELIAEDLNPAATVLDHACASWALCSRSNFEGSAWTDAEFGLPVYVEGDHPWQPAEPA